MQRRLRTWIAMGVMALTLLVPAVAFADTASFSYRAPASGAKTTNTKPTVSVRVYDKHGIRYSSNVYMSIDGVTVKRTYSYIVTGAWDPRHPDYRRIKIAYTPTKALSPGRHKVYVKVKDRRGYTTKSTWYFTVDAPATPYNASFSSPSPANLALSLVATPSISVNVYDKYGVSGSLNYLIRVDGVAQPTSIKYSTSGVYSSFMLTYKVARSLSAGAHTVLATITNLHGDVSTYSWTFSVSPTAIVYEEMPYSGTACADCHVGYPTSHPMTNCRLCHGTGRPVPGVAYSASSTSAHTLSCATQVCHRGPGNTFPHVLGACSDCHGTTTFTDVPAGHSLDVPSLHEAPAAFCIAQGCHLSSLTKEHYRYTKDGARLTCATCHASPATAVQSAIASHSTACTSCHDLTAFAHPGTSTAHTAANTCVQSACHSSDVTTIHKGNCSACHAAGKTPSTTCSNCHTSGTYHSQMPSKHAISNGCTNGSACHTSGDLSIIHTKSGVQHCEACHAPGKTPSNDCISCHGTELLEKHGGAVIKHTAPAMECTNASCHGVDVTTIHKVGDAFKCIACHAVGKTPSTDCTSCHGSDIVTAHKAADVKHVAPSVVCISSECHVTNVSQIHVKNGTANCYACHDTGTSPIKDCSQCHPGELATVHAKAAPRHVASLVTCVSATCHASDVTVIHVNSDGSEDCGACHGKATPPVSTNCTGCHSGDVQSVHSKADPLHVPPAGFCDNVCHGKNVGTIHAGTTLGCAACHSGPTPPSTTNCASCHEGTVQSLHSADYSKHIAQSGTCVAGGICHTANVLAYHDPDGSGAGCWKCHDAEHAAKLDSSLTCSNCHAGDVSTIHPNLSTNHAAPMGTTCIDTPCHSSNVMTIHDAAGTGPGCVACHDGAKTPSTQCSDCHPTDFSTVHVKGAVPHQIAAGGGCYTPTCHVSGNAAVIHQGSVQNCSACHTPGQTATKDCATCHAAGTIPTRHASASNLHQSAFSTCVKSGCHVADVMTLHASGPGCIACHGEGKTPSLTCTASGCHGSDFDTLHDKGTVPHTTTAGYCVRSNCHGGYVTAIHADAPLGCATCHDNPAFPLTANCTTCHGPSQTVVHAKGDTPHTVAQTTCAGYAAGSPCHQARVDDTHRKAPTGCMSCHGTNVTPTTVCATCHTGTLAPTHSSADTSHTTDINNKCTGAMCHATNVMKIHENTTKSCLACHGPDAPQVTTDCTVCHTPHNLPALHAASPASETITISGVDYGTRACSDCHAMDLRWLHGGANSCPTCHTSKISTLVGGTWTKGCVQGGCHTAGSTAPMHANVTGAHILATAPSCTMAGCHTGGTDVAKIHAPALGCASCHGAGKTPSLDCAASGCHPTGAPDTHASHESTMSAAVISINGVSYGTHACSDCHGAAFELQQIHGGPTSCTKCHGGPADTAPAGYFACDQPNCHVSGSKYAAPLHSTINADHTLASAPSCVAAGCHTGGTDIAKIHAPKQGCATCHGSGKTPTAVCATSGCHPTGAPSSHSSHDSTVTAEVISINGVDYGTHNCSECHVPLELQSIHGGATSCATCHPGAADATTGTSGFACAQSGCHVPGSPYAGTVHAAIDGAHTLATTPSCIGTGCHTGGTDVAKIHAPKQGCATCHGSGKTPTLVCATSGCHATGAPGAHSSHPSPDTAGSITINGTAYGVTCAQCHTSMDLQVVHGGPSSCGKCHPSPANTAANANYSCVQGSCHTSNTGNMQVLHGTADTAHQLATQPSCISASCHQGGQDVARIHSYNTVGCGACHGAGKTPSLDCAKCHGTTTGDHTSSHYTQCNDCHWNGGHGSGPSIGGGYYSDCSLCHNKGGSWQHPYVGCHGCDDPSGQWWYGVW